MTAARRALVVGAGGSRGALAGARALAQAGWEVGVAAPDRHGLAWSSRYVARRHLVTPPEHDAAAFAGGVGAALERYGYAAVLPAGDAELLALSAHRASVGPALAVPAHDVVLRALDKLTLTRAAVACGLAAPATWSPEDPWPVGPPVIVKPRLHFDAGRGVAAATRIGAGIAADEAQAREHVDAIEAAGGLAVLQELVAGRLIAFSCVVGRDGRMRAAVQQEALHTHPAQAGITAHGRTVAVDPDLADRVGGLLRSLGWFGLCQLQVLVRDGEPLVIDLNGRLYGSLQIAVAAGVNLPALWAGLAADPDGAAGERADGRPGLEYQWLEGDVRNALATGRGLRPVLATAARARHSVLSGDDPLPALRYLMLLAGRAVRAS